MTDERFHELLGKLLDDALSGEEQAELCRGLERRPELKKEVRGQLALWEVWSQQVNPARSANAFAAKWRAWEEAEQSRDAEAFTQRVMGRVGQEERRASRWRKWLPLELAAAAVVILGTLFWLRSRDGEKPAPAPIAEDTSSPDKPETGRPEPGKLPEPGKAIHAIAKPQLVALRGEGVCLHCTLGEDGPHRMALRVAGPQPAIYILEESPAMRGQVYCAEHPDIVARGEVRPGAKRPILVTQSIERVP